MKVVYCRDPVAGSVSNSTFWYLCVNRPDKQCCLSPFAWFPCDKLTLQEAHATYSRPTANNQRLLCTHRYCLRCLMLGSITIIHHQFAIHCSFWVRYITAEQTRFADLRLMKNCIALARVNVVEHSNCLENEEIWLLRSAVGGLFITCDWRRRTVSR